MVGGEEYSFRNGPDRLAWEAGSYLDVSLLQEQIFGTVINHP